MANIPCSASITALAQAALQADTQRQTTTHQSPRPSTKQEDHCVICLDAMSERAVAVPCNHYAFDFICIASWLQEQSTCPLCKAQVTAVEYDWRGVDDYKTYHVRGVESDSKREGNNGRVTASAIRGRNSDRRGTQAARGQCLHQSAVAEQDPAVLFRRHIYRNDLYSRHIGDNTISGFLTINPSMFASSASLQRKARLWIRRELRVFRYLYETDTSSDTTHSRSVTTISPATTVCASRPRARTHNPEFLIEYIIAMLKQLDIRGADGKCQDLMTEILGKRRYAVLFLHELENWLRGPWVDPRDWDEIVQYGVEVPRPRRRVVRVEKRDW